MFDKFGTTTVTATVLTLACVAIVSAIIIRKKKQSDKPSAQKVFLKGKDTWQQVRLQSKKNLTHNTREFHFVFDEQVPFGLPVGRHIQLRNGDCVRSYTPVEEGVGYFKLVAKIYEQGEMTQFLDSLQIGDHVTLRGPTGQHTYIGGGVVRVDSRRKDKPAKFLDAQRLVLISGGTGITPMLQVIHDVIRRRQAGSEEPALALVQAHSTPKDVILREYIEGLKQQYAEHVDVLLTVSRFDNDADRAEWPHADGRISLPMLQQLVHGHDEKSLVLLCGPPGFVKAAKNILLEQLDFPRHCLIVL